MTASERDDFLAVARGAGAVEVAAFPEPLAAALGSGLDIGSSHAQMILDIGHGVSDGIILRQGEIIASRATRGGCGELLRQTAEAGRAMGVGLSNEEALRRLSGLGLGRSPASSHPLVDPTRRKLPNDGSRWLEEELERWANAVALVPRELFREAPPEVGAELVENGIWVTGGGSLLRATRSIIARVTGLDVRRVPDPLSAVVLANGRLLETADRFACWT